MRDLPPLRALRAFEACYRFNSYTKAASSLNVGQPAISHQIRALEADLGKRLFKKLGAQIEPTAEARAYYATIQPALHAIANASRQMRNEGQYQGVQIGSYPGLATYWLSPRLAQLSTDHPRAAIRLITAEMDRDLALDGLDCAILFGDGNWEGTDSIKLLGEQVVPVCNPSVYETWKDATAQELLTTAPLIELLDQESRWHSWQDWRVQMGCADAKYTPSLTVYNHALALHQALTGQGIALAWRGVVEGMLGDGLLRTLDFDALESERGYYLVAREGFLSSAPGKLLKDYLI